VSKRSDGVLQWPEAAFKPYRTASSLWLDLEMKIRLLNVYVLPVLLCGAETWSLTSVLEKKLDACQQWCLRRLLHIAHLQRITNTEVLRRTNQTQLSTVLCNRHIRLFGHVARSDAPMDHSRALHSLFQGYQVIGGILPTDQTVMDANHWERPKCTQHRSAHGIERSSGSWTMTVNRGSGYAPTWGLPWW